MGVARAPRSPLRLVDRSPRLTPEELAARFVPPRRFSGVRFETYRPSSDHPSQAAALAALEGFAADVTAEAGAEGSAREGTRRRSWWRGKRSDAATASGVSGTSGEGLPARYLDGGFGVGKTHLLAGLWHRAPPPKAYLTFAELTAVIGFEGMEQAVAAFSGYRLVCVDEFELDDVANTLMTVTFLRQVVPAGARVAATSNALPERLGEGRFSAEDFTREIAAIASFFQVVRIDGPDYRASLRATTEQTLSPALFDALADALGHAGAVTVDPFDDVLAHLRQVHPVQLGAMVDGLDGVLVSGLHPIANQGDALLFVQLVDELYDAELTFGATGCAVDELFPDSYRHGGYRKKYGRCESRLEAMLAESRALLT